MGYKIIKKLITPNKYSRPQRRLASVKGIVIHWVANPNSSAMGNRNYFDSRKNGSKGYGSAHYIVGLNETQNIVQAIPESEMAYHVGSRTYTTRALERLGSYPNNSTIGIEATHIDWSGNMTDYTYNALLELSVDLLKKYGLDENDLWLHKTVVGWKDCHRFFVRNNDEWIKFKRLAGEMLRGEAQLNSEVNTDEIEMVDSDQDGFYEIKRGDTLWGISQALDISVDDLLALNTVNPNKMQVGDKIRVREREEEINFIKVKSDVWLHNGANFEEWSRVRVLKAGEEYKVYGEKNDMYSIGNGLYVSKNYVETIDNLTPQPKEPTKVDYPLIKHSSKGEYVEKVQQILKDRGYKIVVDGIFGANTEKAIKEFQRAVGLASDGIVGSNTWAKLLEKKKIYGVSTSDVWIHSKPDFNASTRTKVLGEGQKVDILDGGTSDMYKTNLGYVSKRFILKREY